MGFRVWDSGLEFRISSLGFGVWGVGLGVWGLGFEVWGLGFRIVCGLDLRMELSAVELALRTLDA